MFESSMKFDFGEEIDELRDLVHRWAQERLKPSAARIDGENGFSERALA